MARRRRPKQKQGGDEWLTTYGDMVTLLLTFFVLLFSFSTIDAQKWQSLVSALTGGSGILESGRSVGSSTNIGEDIELDIDVINELIPRNNEKDKETENEEDMGLLQESDEFVKLYISIGEFLEEKGVPAEVKISDAHTEILLRFKDSILFDTGDAEIKIEAREVLDGISQVLKKFDDQIDMVRIDGHADIRPINTQLYPTNWELSARRAVNVVRYFSENQGLKPSKLSATAYGEHHPIDNKKTPDSLARNRRVEIFIVRVMEPAETIESDQ
ncbi:MAG: OmpA family protein [Caldicoprobacterales bacterium]|jgi:chemotaxis protein MotB|nr:OmpA family protein [Clostridiales bacterium]